MLNPEEGIRHPSNEQILRMATKKFQPALPPKLKCDDPGILLKRAVDLIDPPRYSADDGVEKASGVRDCTSDERKPPCDSQDELSMITEYPSELAGGSVPSTRIKPKKVQFKESSCQQTNKISVQDVIQAYDFLIHAAAILSSAYIKNSERKERYTSKDISFLTTSWESVQQYADTYRALLITSCLLLEMLPSDSSNDSENYDAGCERNNTQYPISCTNPPHMPTLSPTITKILLSTSRRCILLLQSLDKLCTMKTISERHTGKSELYYPGGDDIDDYERSASDLDLNYDWHDDGFLPKPCSYNCRKSTTNNHGAGISILHECCYLPHYTSEPPSSKYEKSASTKDWIRGERLISMSLEDYQYYDGSSNGKHHSTNFQDDMLQGIVNQQSPLADRSGGYILPVPAGIKDTTEKNVSDQTRNHSFGSEGSGPEDFSFLNLSPGALAQEEENLLNIMISSEPSNSTNCALPKRKKKKKMSHHQMPEGHTINENQKIQSLSSHRKEGFLLLLSGNQNMDSTIRVYAKLHPSGWLSIEYRDIPSIDHSVKESMGQSLSHRPRYWDYFIDHSTVCQPWTPEGVLSFHFKLDDIRLLGASSLDQSVTSKLDYEAISTNQKVKLLFAVDEATGSTLSDGFEWVCALSELISISKSLHENIYSEWTCEV